MPKPTFSSSLVLGGAVHHGLATYHQSLKDRKVQKPHEVQAAFLNSWDEQEAKQQIDYKANETRADLREQGLALLDAYLQEPPPENIEAVENPIMVPLITSDGEILEKPLLAIADLVSRKDEGLLVTEFKTSNRRYSETETATSLQATCYVHAIEERYGQAASVQYTVLVKSSKPAIQRLTTTRTAQDRTRLADLIQTVERGISAGAFYPIENAMNCSGCPFRKTCKEKHVSFIFEAPKWSEKPRQMLTELRGKGGCVCRPAREGKLHCPLIVRPTSEDVITGEIFQVLNAINPRRWLPDLLNTALGAARFRQQVFRRLKVELWKNRPPYPRELLPWDEGSTQVDSTVTWENPPTTIFFEAKYGSGISKKTAGDNGRHGYPSDQVIRNIRVGLLECGWFDRGEMMPFPRRDFVLIVLTPRKGHGLVNDYRDVNRVTVAIPHSHRLHGLPPRPFVGELDYRDVTAVLRRQRKWCSRAERTLIDDLTAYLEFKGNTVPSSCRDEQLLLAVEGEETNTG